MKTPLSRRFLYRLFERSHLQLPWAAFSSVGSRFHGVLEMPLTRSHIECETGIISAVLVTLRTDLGHQLTSSKPEMVTSLTSGGVLIGGVIAGLKADKFGRKLVTYIGCPLFFVGFVVWASSFSVAQMSVARFVVGLGVGSAAMIIVSEQHHSRNNSSRLLRKANTSR
jgi:MFS family permease